MHRLCISSPGLPGPTGKAGAEPASETPWLPCRAGLFVHRLYQKRPLAERESRDSSWAVR